MYVYERRCVRVNVTNVTTDEPAGGTPDTAYVVTLATQRNAFAADVVAAAATMTPPWTVDMRAPD